MPSHPEHSLQILVNKWVRAHVEQPHFFCGIDRAKATGRFTHIREKARGIIAGTPDTIMVIPGMPLIAVELKAPGNKPTDRQKEVGEVIIRSGHYWHWCDSVKGYAIILHDLHAPLIGNWYVAAEGHDATLASAAIRAEESKTGKVSRKRFEAKASPSKIRRTEKIRAGIRF